MFEILLYFEIGASINVGPGYWAILTIICFVKILKFIIWCISKD